MPDMKKTFLSQKKLKRGDKVKGKPGTEWEDMEGEVTDVDSGGHYVDVYVDYESANARSVHGGQPDRYFSISPDELELGGSGPDGDDVDVEDL